MSTKKIAKDKVYRLLTGTPLSYTLPSRNHPSFPLMYFDEDKNINRVLRYATNQKSPFEDEQDGNAVLQPIVFEDGLLSVPKNNPVLQEFLHYHPLNGKIFAEVDNERDANKELEDINIEVEALIAAKALSVKELETMTRVIFGKDPSSVSTAELKRDILIFAKDYPSDFLDIMNDPELNYQAKIRTFFENKLLILKNNNKEIHFNTPTNKKKMMTVPFNESYVDAACQFLKSEEGIDAMKMLETASGVE